MTTFQTAIFQVKQYFLDVGLVIGVSLITNFWHAISDELNLVLVAHTIVLLVVSVLVRILGRWIGEHIDEMSDLDFMESFVCDRSTFELLKNIDVHGRMYKPNIDHMVYDRNKIKIYSKFFGIKTVETFELIVSMDSVVLKNISGKYESSVTYEYEGSAIIAHWIAKPKGLRRALGLFFSNAAMRNMKADVQKFVNDNKI